MDLDELERRTREQLRALQEEYQKRAEPLNKILMDIHNCRPPKPAILDKEQAEEFMRRNGISMTEAYYKK